MSPLFINALRGVFPGHGTEQSWWCPTVSCRDGATCSSECTRQWAVRTKENVSKKHSSSTLSGKSSTGADIVSGSCRSSRTSGSTCRHPFSIDVYTIAIHTVMISTPSKEQRVRKMGGTPGVRGRERDLLLGWLQSDPCSTLPSHEPSADAHAPGWYHTADSSFRRRFRRSPLVMGCTVGCGSVGQHNTVR